MHLSKHQQLREALWPWRSMMEQSNREKVGWMKSDWNGDALCSYWHGIWTSDWQNVVIICIGFWFEFTSCPNMFHHVYVLTHRKACRQHFFLFLSDGSHVQHKHFGPTSSELVPDPEANNNINLKWGNTMSNGPSSFKEIFYALLSNNTLWCVEKKIESLKTPSRSASISYNVTRSHTEEYHGDLNSENGESKNKRLIKCLKNTLQQLYLT